MVANIKFFGTEQSRTEKSTLKFYFNEDFNEIRLIVDDNSAHPPQVISLNKATAVAIVKKLKFEISKMEG